MYTRKRRPKRKTKRGGAIDWGLVAAISIGVGAAGLLGTSFYLDANDPEVQADVKERRAIAASQGRSTWGI